MPETLYKLQPDRTLELGFFNHPASNAALHSTSPSGWKLSGRFRTQHDYAIVEWNKYNRWDHPGLAYLPDGDLSGLILTYNEERIECQPMESAAYAYTDWPHLLIWARAPGGSEALYRVPLQDHATAVLGSLAAATAGITVGGTVAAGDVISLTIMTEKYSYTVQASDTLESIAAGIAAAVNTGGPLRLCQASSSGTTVTLEARASGRDGNGIAYQVTRWNEPGPPSVQLTPETGLLSGGSSAATWHVSLDFGSLVDTLGGLVPTTDVRRLRWVYSPPLKFPDEFNGSAEFQPLDFLVQVSNWSVAGSGSQLAVADSLSRRFEDDSPQVSFTGSGWNAMSGNVSGEAMRYTLASGDAVEVVYSHPWAHTLYLGTQRTYDSAIIQVQIDGGVPFNLDLYTPGGFPSDIFRARERLATGLAQGSHTVRISHTGTKHIESSGLFFYFDFVEAAVPSQVTDPVETRADLGLATDYDTAALWLPPERLAWSVDRLGLKGELNHFAGTEFFYDKLPTGWSVASATVQVGGTVTPGDALTVTIGSTAITHLVAYGDTLQTIARALAMAVNNLTSVWAEAADTTVSLHARVPGSAANSISLHCSTNQDATETLTASGPTLAGGVDGGWWVDPAASPILNVAARDWHTALAAQMLARGMTVRMALSLELKHAPVSWGQTFADGTVVITQNGTVQISPSVPEAKQFWKDCHRALAQAMRDAGAQPRLQFGEIQWWYSAGGSPASMPYYDPATAADFQALYGRPLYQFTSPNDDPSVNSYQDAAFLRDRLGAFCDEVRAAVLASFADADFEVLWPRDVNDPDFNRLNYYVNLPAASWTPATIARFKTEAFQEANPQRNMNKARVTVGFPFTTLAFAPAATRHLLGVMPGFPWESETQVALNEGIELVTLWAWDQFCAIGRALPVTAPYRNAQYIGP